MKTLIGTPRPAEIASLERRPRNTEISPLRSAMLVLFGLGVFSLGMSMALRVTAPAGYARHLIAAGAVILLVSSLTVGSSRPNKEDPQS